MKTILAPIVASLAGICFIVNVYADDPRTNSWFTTYAGKYARIYTNDAMLAAGAALTKWSNGSQFQTNPAYCGVQEIYVSTNWVYVRSTGLAGYIMGPWQNGAFPNLPVNQKVLFRFPRTNGVPTTKSLTGAGQIGIFADGVEMFNSWDAFYWNGSADTSAGASNGGYWNRDAYVNEGATFDPGYAHQQQGGTYHYHADPIALRYQLGDHVDYNSSSKTYSESTNTPTKHSPLLAWTSDGFPVYGPYGYSVSNNASSGIRRMVSGYVVRNGQYGTSNLTNGRMTIPQWAVRLYGVASNILAGPAVSSSYPLGRYMEDNDYLGDVVNTNTGGNFQQGADFDLDEYNGRYCVTPEFPSGTYAYFVAINSNGTPVFPYNIGRGFYGSPVGGSVSAISETVVTNFLGNTNLPTTLNPPSTSSGMVTLSWSAIEGGSYQVESTTNLSSWTVVTTGVKAAPNQIIAGYTNSNTLDKNFYRVGRTSVANFDSAGTTLFASETVAPGGSATRGQTVIVTITLPGSPPNPPANAPITSVVLTNSVSNFTGSNISDATQGYVVATFVLTNVPTGTQSENVVVTFQGGPPQPYTLTNGFTIY